MLFKFSSDLQTTMWRTAGTRFIAARRLNFRNWMATLSIALFSIVGIFLPMAQRIFGLSAGSMIDNYYTALALLLSLFVLVISLVEGSQNYPVQADNLHRNAEHLTELRREFAQTLARAKDVGQLEFGEVDTFRQRYEELIQGCHYNHAPIDDRLFLAKNRCSGELKIDGQPRIGPIEAWRLQIWYWVRAAGLHVVSWIIVAATLVAYIRTASE